jgi:hypothetical protein
MWEKIRSSFPRRPALGRRALDSGLSEAFSAPPSSAMRSAPPPADAAWQKACEIYLRQLTLHPQGPQPAACADWGELHLAVAELIWEQRSETRPNEAKRLLHISHAALGLLAVHCPEMRLVQVRSHPSAFKLDELRAQMSVRVMPMSAKLLEGPAAQDFQTLPLTLLMWHYGQTSAVALAHMPSLSDRWLYLRRFPALAPNMLSREPVRFEDLLNSLPPEERNFLCPDLTSLYFTGALLLQRSQGSERPTMGA